MRLALLGGSFDPPHLGHLAIAEAARDRFALDRILLAPAGRQPLKSSGATASYEARLAMTQLLCTADPAHLTASDLDAPRPNGLPNYTVGSLHSLRSTFPGAQLFAIAGLDSFLDLPHWRCSADLLLLAEWIVVSRPGHPLPTPLPPWIPPQRVHFIKEIAVPLASRQLRADLLQRADCTAALPPAILDYIRQNRLYQQPGSPDA